MMLSTSSYSRLLLLLLLLLGQTRTAPGYWPRYIPDTLSKSRKEL